MQMGGDNSENTERKTLNSFAENDYGEMSQTQR